MKKTNTGAFDSMKKLFPVSKTISFRLLPVGRTEERMRENAVLGQDVLPNVIERSERLKADYRLLKDAADRYHKEFIETVLSSLRLRYLSEGSMNSIQEYAEAYFDPDMRQSKKEEVLSVIAANLKKQVADAFKAMPYNKEKNMLSALASSLLVKEILTGATLSDKERAAVERLTPYTSYMRPYFTTRDRMYQAEQKGNTIPIRIVDENLPLHLNNTKLFKAVPEQVLDGIQPLFETLAPHMQAYAIQDVFTPSYFSLLPAQSAIDRYNTLIGGYTLEDGTKVKGLNEIINDYNYTKPEKKIAKFKKLKKQILSDKTRLSWTSDVMTLDEEAVNAAEGIHGLIEAFNKAESYSIDPSTVYVSVKRLHGFSRTLLGNATAAERAIRAIIRRQNPQSPREKEKGYAKRLDAIYKSYGAFSIRDIFDAVTETGPAEGNHNDPVAEFNRFYKDQILAPVLKAERKYKSFLKKIHSGATLKNRNDDRNDATGYLKDFLDCLTDAKNAASTFTDLKGTLEVDDAFYQDVVAFFSDFAEVFTPIYNTIRNYLTKKPFSTDKIELHFDNPTVLAGWDIDKESINKNVILRKGDKLYVGIMPKDSGRLFTLDDAYDKDSELKKMTLKVIPNPFMMLPKVAFKTEARRAATCPEGMPYEPWHLYLKSGKAVKDYTREEVAIMVDYFKDVIANKREWDIFQFTFKDTSEYERLNDFYQDVARQAYHISYNGVSERFVNNAVEAGNLYLFEITCQDMLEKHHGKDGNYKVLLYEALSGRPGCDVRLCGGAAIYFRKASLERKVTHPAGVPIPNKNPDTANATRTLGYDLIKDRRYTEDQYQFHLPVSVYPTADSLGANKVNAMVQQVIKANPDMYVLGINRGERNLVSIAVTAPDGTIVEQRNLNVFDNVDYQRKLAEREKERNSNRRNWSSIKDIKNLKAGYLSRVIGEVVTLFKKYNCVIAMERLDKEFKSSRRAFEMSIYDQFERNLINKLAFLMDKNDTDRMAGILQLANPGKTEQERIRFPQNGIVFLMNPSYISNTDPLTGFVNRLPFYYENIRECEELMSRMDSFRYDKKKDRFVLAFHYGKAVPEKEAGDPKRTWRIETYGERTEQFYDTSGDSSPKGTVDLTEEMKAVFRKAGIPYEDGKDLLPALNGQGAEFWKGLMRLLRLTVKQVNWYGDTRELRVIGCTADSHGVFYDSRTAPERMPKDGDTYAAWNIARKAHVILRNIRNYNPGNVKETDGRKPQGPGITLTDAEWFAAVQK